jgi:hypothetical protein
MEMVATVRVLVAQALHRSCEQFVADHSLVWRVGCDPDSQTSRGCQIQDERPNVAAGRLSGRQLRTSGCERQTVYFAAYNRVDSSEVVTTTLDTEHLLAGLQAKVRESIGSGQEADEGSRSFDALTL